MTEELIQQLDGSEGRKIFADYLKTTFGSDEKLSVFDGLTDLYLQVMQVMNISAIKTIDDIYIKHYLDSVYPYTYMTGTVCDVGCGGGFPSLPLAIMTDLTITGLDSVGKKLLLIHRAVSELRIKNIKADYARSEDLVKLHRSYDTVCARALADTDKSLILCAPLAKVGVKIVLYKTQNDKPATTETLSKTYVTLEDTVDYVLPGTDIKRRVYIYKK